MFITTKGNCVLMYIAFILFLLISKNDVNAKGGACDIHVLFSCQEGEICSQTSAESTKGICLCRPDYEQVNEKCVSPAVPNPTSPHTTEEPFTAQPQIHTASDGSSIAGIFIPLFLIIVIVGALLYFGKRYNWLHRLQQLRPFHRRRTNDVAIGRPDDDDDDEPIA